MRVGFFAPANEFSDGILDGLKQKLVDDSLTQWQPGGVPPEPAIEVLFALGPVDRALMESLPNLAFIQVLSDGYESLDLEAATELGIGVSYSPGDVTGNADSVAEYTVLLMLAAARRLSVALASIHNPSIQKPGSRRLVDRREGLYRRHRQHRCQDCSSAARIRSSNHRCGRFADARPEVHSNLYPRRTEQGCG